MPEPNEAMVEAASRVLYDWLYEHPDWTGEDILDGDLARSVLAAVSPGCRGAELARLLEALSAFPDMFECFEQAPTEDPGLDLREVVIPYAMFKEIAEALAAVRASGEAGPEIANFDSVWADARPLCHVCRQEIPQGDAVILPGGANGLEDDDEFVGVLVHRSGCPESGGVEG